MQGKHWVIALFVLILGAFGCRAANPYHCPNGSECPPVGGPCETSGECRAPTPLCNEEAMTCVECLKNTDCTSLHPLCNSSNMCVQCQVDDDCDSKLCLAGGACADPGDVTYVGGAGADSNKACSLDMPCQNLVQALDPMVPDRKYIKITGVIADPDVAFFVNKKVTLYGRGGAQISRSSPNEVLIIKGTSDVTMMDLEIIGNPASGDKDCVEILETAAVAMIRVDIHGHGIAGLELADSAKLVMTDSKVHDNVKDGVKVTGGTLEIRHSSIYLNRGTAGVFATGGAMVTIESSIITRNTGSNGGVSIVGPLVIRNNIISGNGDAATVIGGLFLSSANATFEFNTVADNVSNANPDVGIICVNPIAVSNSILTGNVVNGCLVTYSLTDTTLTGEGNLTGLPMFKNTDIANPSGPMFYRIDSTSKARDMANPAATLDVDIDGEARSDARKDMGADEFR